MSLREKINQQFNTALKNKDKTLVSTLRLIMAAIKDKDIAKALDLPPKIYTTRQVDLTMEQERYYQSIKKTSVALLESGEMVTTPEVMILDRPPVAPDVNIVPYRAVNDKIKILFNGMVDRYRDFPIYINKQIDKPNFDFIAKAQFSPDGKVEFGSDDPIKSFETIIDSR